MIRKMLLAGALATMATPALAAVDVTGFEVDFSFSGDRGAALVFPGGLSFIEEDYVNFFQKDRLERVATYSLSDSGASAYASVLVSDYATYSSKTSGSISLYSKSYARSFSNAGIYADAIAGVIYNSASLIFTLDNDAYFNGQKLVPGFYSFELSEGNFALTDSLPETGTWAMMLAGFGVIGSAMRRQKIRAAHG